MALMGVRMEVILLGPVAVVRGNRTVPINSARQAALLAALALRPGRTLDRDRLVEAIWGEDPPDTARNTLQVHASSLRRLVGSDVLQTVGDGYRFVPARDVVDVHVLEDRFRAGKELQEQAEYEDASLRFHEALALWDTPFVGLETAWFDREREWLRRLHHSCLLARIDVDLVLGRHRALASELDALSAESPYDEELALRHVTALLRCGRRPEAVRVHDAMLRRLDAELGVQPGPELSRSVTERPSEVPPWTPVPLVGREELVDATRSALLAGGVVTLVGPTGAGKTALARAMAARAQHEQGKLPVWIDDASADIPWQAPDTLLVLDDPPRSPAILAAVTDRSSRADGAVLVTSPRPLGITGEHVVPVAPLSGSAAGDLLLSRAREAGAGISLDDSVLARSRECAALVDRLPGAVERIAPLATSGLADLAGMLHGARGVEQIGLSHSASIDLLDPGELLLLDLVATAEGPLSGDVLATAGTGRDLAALVRDGLVRRVGGSEDVGLFEPLRTVALFRRTSRSEAEDRDSRRRLLLALADVVGEIPQYLPMLVANAEHARRLVSLQPAIDAVVGAARDLDLAEPAARVALVVPELYFSVHGAGPPPGRFDWLCDQPRLSRGRRIDLLLSLAVEYVYADQPGRAHDLLATALREARALGHPGRLAQALAHLHFAQARTGEDMGATPAVREEAMRLATESHDPAVVAGTLLLLYPDTGAPTARAPLFRAVAHARSAGHHGLLALALCNLAAVLLESGDVDEARVHALEAVELATESANRSIVTSMRAVVATCRALAIGPEDLAAMVEAVRLGWERQEMRTCCEAVLMLAAALRGRDLRDDARRCLGLYRALLIRYDSAPTASERRLSDQWLDGLAAELPDVPLGRAVADLVRDFGSASPAP